MTPLRQRMLHELQRRNYSPSTIRSYLGAVRFAEHFHRSPEQLGPEHLRRYQRYLLQERKLAPSSLEMRISALRFLYKRTLKRKDLAFYDLIFPKVPHKLPIVLSLEEVVRLIEPAPNRLYRILLLVLYATGARRAEAARIMVEDIDSQRMVIHIRQGKGAKDRDVPLSPKLLEELRSWWRWKKPQGYLFPSTDPPHADACPLRECYGCRSISRISPSGCGSALPWPAFKPWSQGCKEQMTDFGGMLSFRAKGGGNRAIEIASQVRLFINAGSLGGSESLIQHAVSVMHPADNIPNDLLRVSVGLEHPDDLIADLRQALV